MNPLTRGLRCLILLTLLLLPCPGRTDELRPNIENIFLSTSQTHLLLFCSVQNGFTREMIEGVRSGTPVTFTFHVTLDKVLRGWPDSTLKEMTFDHTLAYDSAREQYRVILSERGGEPLLTGSLDEALAKMNELNGVTIIDRNELVPDAPYALHVHATLVEKTLPLNLHQAVPFVSLWDFATETRTIEFRY